MHRALAAEHFIRDVPSLPRVLASHGYASLQTGKLWEGDFRNSGFTHGMTLNKPSPDPAYGNRKVSDSWVAHGNGDAGLNIGRDTMEPLFDFVREHKHSPFLVWYAADDARTPRSMRRTGIATHEFVLTCPSILLDTMRKSHASTTQLASL